MSIYDMNVLSLKYEEKETRLDLKHPFLYFLQKALPCDHQAPAGEMVERDPQGSGPFQDGTIVVYTCPDGYNLVGDTTAVCQNGKWTVEEEPTCEGIFQTTRQRHSYHNKYICVICLLKDAIA